MGGLAGRALRPGDRLPVGTSPSDRFPVGTLPERRPASGPPAPGPPIAGVTPLPKGGRSGQGTGGTGHRRLRKGRDGSILHDSVSGDIGIKPHGLSIEWPSTHAVGTWTIHCPPLSPTGRYRCQHQGNRSSLLADRQTVGGYPRIATVISADLPVLGQLTASHWIEFETCSHETARRALLALEQSLIA